MNVTGPLTNRTQWFKEGAWIEGKALPYFNGLCFHSIVAISDTEVLLAGGYDGTATVGSTFIYNLLTETFTSRVKV